MTGAGLAGLIQFPLPPEGQGGDCLRNGEDGPAGEGKAEGRAVQPLGGDSAWEEVSADRQVGAAPLLTLPRSLKEMMGSLPKDSGQGLDGLSGGCPTPVGLSLPLSSHHWLLLHHPILGSTLSPFIHGSELFKVIAS